MSWDEMNSDDCAYCGAQEFTGYGYINQQRFCHGDSPLPTCYMLALKKHKEKGDSL